MAQESEQERETMVRPDMGALETITRADIDQQIATAHAYPRSVKRFIEDARDLATLTEEVAAGCIYALPRDGKTIEGPSARFAEIVASSWGNCRAGARIVGEDQEFVTAQGVFHDLQRNVAITYEVKRRITDRKGRRYKPDMIGVTANAACSIALRNAVLKGVPKAFWSEIYNDVRRVIVGDSKTLANRRAEALGYLQKFGATEEMVLAKLGRDGVESISGDDLVLLRGLATALKEGDTTVEEAFAPEETAGKPSVAPPQRKSGKGEKKSPQPEPDPIADPEPVEAPDIATLRDMADAGGWPEKQLAQAVGAEDFDQMNEEQRGKAARILAEAQ